MKWIISVVIGVIGFYFTLKQAEGENISKAVVCFLAAILTGLVTSFIYDAIKPMFMDSGSTYVIETTGSPVTSSYEESAPYETTEEETSPPKTEPHSTEQSSFETMAESTNPPATTEEPTHPSTQASTEAPTQPAVADVTGMSSFQGKIQKKAQEDQYRYTASVSGAYRFDTDLSSGGQVRVEIRGENGVALDYGTNGLTIDLTAGKSYILSIGYRNGPCDYQVSIGVPKEIQDITGASVVSGRITYRGQNDNYRYTAPVSGTYRFDTKVDAAAKVNVQISGENGNSIEDGINVLNIDLEAGKTYLLSVEYNNGPSDYEIHLGVPQPIRDIMENTSVAGSMLYRNQKDRYRYTALTSGTYRFDTVLSSGGQVDVRISGQNGQRIKEVANGLTIELVSGETYILSVEYRNAPCDYVLNIGVPMEPISITEDDFIGGSITYRDQKDRYYYMAPYTGTYIFDTEVSTDANVNVRISGENEKSLKSGIDKLRVDLEEGKLYILSIEYKNGFGEYEVYMELP